MANELTVDVAIIGSGAAGLCAALTLGASGARVAVLEKMHAIGGMSNFAEAMFAVESKLQKRLKIGVTVEQAFRSHMEKCHWQPNGRLVNAFMAKTADTVEWLEEMGVVFTDVKAIYPDGPRVWHFIKGLSAVGLIRPLSEKIAAMPNIQIMTETPLKKILRVDGGEILGVVAEDKDGATIRVRTKAVLVACGGFQNNREWMEKYFKGGRYIHALIPSQQNGEPIQMAWDVGAAPDGLGVLQSFPFVPGERNLGSQLLHAGMQPFLWINKKGERFCDETTVWRFPIICNAMLEQPDAMAWSIFDGATKQYLREVGIQYSVGEFMHPSDRLDQLDTELEDGMKEGKVLRGASIEELAGKLNMDATSLKATVAENNECCDRGRDLVFFKDPAYLRPVRKPDFYAFRLNILALITEGGIKINHKMEALDKAFDVIPGLYAAGCCVGGLVGETYNVDSTGASISFACNSGRIAGESILKHLNKQSS